MTNHFLNITAYKFVSLAKDFLPKLRATLRYKSQSLGLKGTILLSEEGINLYLAGRQNSIEQLKSYLATFSVFNDLFYKESCSETQPYQRMLVKIKPEIITFRTPNVKPLEHTAPYLSPKEFKKWYETKPDMVVLDTRNTYEVEMGTFENALDLKLKHFCYFPDAVKKLDPALKNKTIVTFCTGGIRCEKAARYMLQQGFKEVYQLAGGILNYFQECGRDHYQGSCFVFDERVSI